VVLVNKTGPNRITQEVERLSSMDYSIHYHVWDPPAFQDLLRFCQEVQAYSFQIERTAVIGHEIIVIARIRRRVMPETSGDFLDQKR
jgi:hypothetical protein